MSAAPFWRSASDLLGSMRFAISSLSILAIASVIGTLLRQREPLPNYVNQFGPFWADLFGSAGLYEVYNAWWFILVLAFLLVSTSLCLVRNTPKMLRDMSAWREKVRATGLRAFRHRGTATVPGAPAQAAEQVSATLKGLGYRVKLDARPDGVMVAAKRGSANRLGYVFAHAGIVVICLGGLLDSEMPLRAAVSWLDKKPLAPTGMLVDPPVSSRLPIANPSWRGNVFLPEGGAADVALLNVRDGVLIQELPFRIELKQFRVEYYSTGMPKLFASDVEIVERATGARRSATIKVNEPLIHDGIAIYQSSFDDGGSRLKLRAVALDGSKATAELTAAVGSSVPLGPPAGQPGAAAGQRLEITAFKPINVENLARPDAMGETERRFKDSVAAVLSPSAEGRGKDLRNVGASFQYKLRDAAGQAREYHVYMHPVELDGANTFLAGVRDNPNEGFRYMRIPADDKGSMDEYLRLRAALASPEARAEAARRYAMRVAPREGAEQVASMSQLNGAAQRSLDLFGTGGLQAMAGFIEKNVPEADQERVADALLKVLGGALWELWQVARDQAGLAPMPGDEPSGRFLQLAQNALSDGFLFGSPVLFTLEDFQEVKASVLQMSRAPGKNVVYLGSLLLVLGVFAMFYVRERRVWCWLAAGEGASGTSDASFAMSSARQSLDLDQDFQALSSALGAHSAAGRS